MRYRPFEDLYNEVLINEINQEVLDYIYTHRKSIKPRLPFDRIFGGKLRFVIPLQQENEFTPVLEKIRQLPYFYKFDETNGKAVFKKPRDNRDGRGDWTMKPITIGQALNELDIPEDERRHYNKLYAKYKDGIIEQITNPNSEYSIVMSRSPNDIIRMSDWPELKSCLSKTGCNFHRVTHEAIDGGGVAYLVKTKDIEDYKDDPDFLQGDDTFSDRQRDVDEILEKPLARLRLRRFVNDKGLDFAIPEYSVFGNRSIPNFYESVVNYLKPQQETKEQIIKAFEEGDIRLKGSSYGMAALETLLGKYFNTGDVHEFIPYSKEDRDKEREHDVIKTIAKPDPDDLEEELSAIDERMPLTHTYSSYDIQGFDLDDQIPPEYTFSGGVTIEFEDDLTLSEEIDEDLSDYWEIQKRIKEGDNFGLFIQELSEKQFGYYSMRGYYYNEEYDRMHIDLTPDDAYSSDSETYEEFRTELSSIDDNYEDLYDEIVAMLLRYGLIESADSEGYNRLKAEQTNENDWNNFRHDADLKRLHLMKYGPIKLITSSINYGKLRVMLDYPYFQTEFNRFCNAWRGSIADAVKESMLNYMDRHFNPPSANSETPIIQESLRLIYEQMKSHPSEKYLTFDFNIAFFTEYNTINFSNFSLITSTSKDVAFELADFWDAHWIAFLNIATLIAWDCVKQTVSISDKIENEYNQFLGFMPDDLVQLQREYGQYVDTSPIGKI